MTFIDDFIFKYNSSFMKTKKKKLRNTLFRDFSNCINFNDNEKKEEEKKEH